MGSWRCEGGGLRRVLGKVEVEVEAKGEGKARAVGCLRLEVRDESGR